MTLPRSSMFRLFYVLPRPFRIVLIVFIWLALLSAFFVLLAKYFLSSKEIVYGIVFMLCFILSAGSVATYEVAKQEQKEQEENDVY